MKITILTAGSQGDIQPFVALALGLQAAGEEVTLCTGRRYAAFVTRYGLNFAPMNDDFLNFADTDEGRAAVDGGSKFGLINKVKPLIRKMLDDQWQAAQHSQAIIYHPKTLGAPYIAEKLAIPVFMSIPLPLYTPTRAFPSPILPQSLRLGGIFNRLSYSVIHLIKLPYMGVINDWRASIGLPKRSWRADDLSRADGTPVPVLYSYSPAVVPTPPDYPASTHVTGYWFLDAAPGWQSPADLQAFLDAGAPPVYVGFGSMTGADPQAKARLVVDALHQAGQRGVIASGWGGLQASDLPDDIFMLDRAPHDWLFPRTAAVVHHGGAGTTAAGLRAGKPTVICPFFGDQPFWGQWVCQLGVGTQPIPQKRLTVESLANAIRAAVTNPDICRRAEALGAQIRAEHGVANAVHIIQQSAELPVAHPR
ncbi:MAG: glycosyltransferase [Chloroflexota bacterium]